MVDPNTAPGPDDGSRRDASDGADGTSPDLDGDAGSACEDTAGEHPGAHRDPVAGPEPGPTASSAPEPSPTTIDAEFARIVRALRADGPGAPEPRRPDEDGPSGDAAHRDDADAAGAPDVPEPTDDAAWSFPRAPWVRAAGPRDRSATPELEELEEEQSHFEPPEPGTLLGRDPVKNLAWSVVALVPLAALASVLFWQRVPAVAFQVAGALFVAALGVLVWRMPSHHDPDDPDPGAVV
ncbi:MAG: hypothetical protein ACTMIR_03065 [Cellulomonadaceae bacterium]